MTITVRTIFSINATDGSHDFLVIRRGHAGISIEAQSREDEWESATAGPFTPEQLRAALDEVAPAGSYTRTDEEDWQARAEKAEQDRDEARSDARRASARWRKELTLRLEVADELRRLRATQARPLTPDAITDEMVERAVNAYATRRWNDGAVGYLSHKHNDAMREALTLALTEPPARPEGAEELGELIGTWTASEDIAPAQLPTGSLATLADFLAERGVRVVTEEQP